MEELEGMGMEAGRFAPFFAFNCRPNNPPARVSSPAVSPHGAAAGLDSSGLGRGQ